MVRTRPNIKWSEQGGLAFHRFAVLKTDNYRTIRWRTLENIPRRSKTLERRSKHWKVPVRRRAPSPCALETTAPSMLGTAVTLKNVAPSLREAAVVRSRPLWSLCSRSYGATVPFENVAHRALPATAALETLLPERWEPLWWNCRTIRSRMLEDARKRSTIFGDAGRRSKTLDDTHAQASSEPLCARDNCFECTRGCRYAQKRCSQCVPSSCGVRTRCSQCALGH